MSDDAHPSAKPPLILSLLRLARPHQWTKNIFVLLGPLYGLRDLATDSRAQVLTNALIAAGVFALASSACYTFNDLKDAEADRVHPRKRKRPIAAGHVVVAQAWALIAICIVGAGALCVMLPDSSRAGVAALAGAYVINVLAYSQVLKKAVVADVVSLSLGFVLRVMGGCAAAGIAPSTWLMNCTLFLAMFLAFAKRLGERRTAEAAGFDATKARGVQAKYTDHLLRMFVVVTAVAALITYSGYVQSRDGEFASLKLSLMPGFNWLWVTLVPATFALLRGIVQTERGTYDDPTEMALHDRPMQFAVAAFGLTTVVIMAFKAGFI